jgi:hypothetical protein
MNQSKKDGNHELSHQYHFVTQSAQSGGPVPVSHFGEVCARSITALSASELPGQ